MKRFGSILLLVSLLLSSPAQAFSFSPPVENLAKALSDRSTETHALERMLNRHLDLNAQEGDLIFQQSQSSQSAALEEATLSRWTHVGMLIREGGRWAVAEAVGPVKKTSLLSFIGRGKDRRFVLKRVREESIVLNEGNLALLKTEMDRFYGTGYDVFFEWSDRLIYCSEFIWKAYARAFGGLALSPPQKMGEMKLDGPHVKKLIRDRYEANGKKLNLEEPIVTPVALFESDAVQLIFDSHQIR